MPRANHPANRQRAAHGHAGGHGGPVQTVKGILVTVDEDQVYAVKAVERPDEPTNRGVANTLHWMYKVLGVHQVDVVRLDEKLDMWLDDEGMFASPVNHLATAIAQMYGFTHQPYYGNVLFLGGADRNGNTLGLNEAMTKQLVRQIEEATT